MKEIILNDEHIHSGTGYFFTIPDLMQSRRTITSIADAYFEKYDRSTNRLVRSYSFSEDNARKGTEYLVLKFQETEKELIIDGLENIMRFLEETGANVVEPALSKDKEVALYTQCHFLYGIGIKIKNN